MSPAGQKQKPAALIRSSLVRASQNCLKDFLGDAWSALLARVERHLAAVLALILLDTAG